jgi:N-acyl-D-amino-acid deacylase
MFDLLIKGGQVVDGRGGEPFTADIAVQNGLIVEIGQINNQAKQTVHADGALVTPGWVDVHTHYDGQATWDPYLTPSNQHGVTTAVMGNCGVGFAPVKPDKRDWLISVMEGVEDIPGSVLSEGIDWQWESFPEYLDALAAKPHAIDIGTQIPHSALRTYVMGERGVQHDEASGTDIAQMTRLVQEGLSAGALGFSTSRTLIHKYQQHKYPPGTFASPDELLGIGRAIKAAGHGVFQMTSNHVGMEGELPWLTQLARSNNLPVAFACVQTDQSPDTWQRIAAHLDKTHAEGVPLYGAIAARPAGLIMGWQGSVHPFVLHPLWRELAVLPWPARLARLQQAETRAALTHLPTLQAAAAHHAMAAYITQSFHRMFRLDARVDYEPEPSQSAAVYAQTHSQPVLDVLYDWLSAEQGEGLIYFPSFNYANHHLDHLHTLLQHPKTMLSLADGGAHCGFICDVSMPSYVLTHWSRDRSRGPRLPLAQLVKKQTLDTAQVYGLHDRGQLTVGKKADINLIDYAALSLHKPQFVYDLPAGGRRLTQGANGYLATYVAGRCTMQAGQPTGEMAGQLIRGPKA